MYEEENTYTGRHFDPLKITADDIDIRDIAHALSLICRGGGQLSHFFSVGQHSINCALEAQGRNYSPRVILACLLHDASEAYISDVVRPVKRYLPEYFTIENQIQQAVFSFSGINQLDETEYKQVFGIDDEILVWELREMLVGCKDLKRPNLALNPALDEKPWREVEQQFLATYEKWKLK